MAEAVYGGVLRHGPGGVFRVRERVHGGDDRRAVGVFQVAIVWGLGIATAIYLTGALSGAYLNPAVTVSMAVWSSFPKGRVLPYVAPQLGGAFAASAVLFCVKSATASDGPVPLRPRAAVHRTGTTT